MTGGSGRRRTGVALRGPASRARWLPACLLLAGCAALERGGDDLRAVGTFPIHAVTTPYGRMEQVAEAQPVLAGVGSPVLIPLFLGEDVLLTAISVGDAALTPAYAPFRVRPLHLYDYRRFPPRLKPGSAAAVESAVLSVPLAVGGLYAMAMASQVQWQDAAGDRAPGPR